MARGSTPPLAQKATSDAAGIAFYVNLSAVSSGAWATSRAYSDCITMRQSGYCTVRYRGLDKLALQILTLTGLGNLYRVLCLADLDRGTMSTVCHRDAGRVGELKHRRQHGAVCRGA